MVCVVLAGSYPEAIRDLEMISRKREVAVPVHLALIYYHNQSSMPDMEAVAALEANLPKIESRAGEVGLLLASRFCWLVGNVAKARKLVQVILNQNPDNPRALTLRGWIDLTVPRVTRRDKDAFRKSLRYFENAQSARLVALDTALVHHEWLRFRFCCCGCSFGCGCGCCVCWGPM